MLLVVMAIQCQNVVIISMPLMIQKCFCHERSFHQGCTIFYVKDYNLDQKKWKGSQEWAETYRHVSLHSYKLKTLVYIQSHPIQRMLRV
jgi:hypothetical protein